MRVTTLLVLLASLPTFLFLLLVTVRFARSRARRRHRSGTDGGRPPAADGDFYDVLAGHYTALFGSSDETVAFLASCGAVAGARVLDVACGTAAYTRELLDRGVDAYGVDLSPPMIARGRELLGVGRADRITVADMLEIDSHPAAPFDLVFCIGNSIAHLDRMDDVGRFARAARASLAPAGTFVLQFVDIGDVPPGSSRELPSLSGGGATMRRVYRRLDQARIRFDAELERPDGTVSRVSQQLLVLETALVASLLREAGFGSVEAWGGFDRSPPTDGWVRVMRAARGV